MYELSESVAHLASKLSVSLMEFVATVGQEYLDEAEDGAKQVEQLAPVMDQSSILHLGLCELHPPLNYRLGSECGGNT